MKKHNIEVFEFPSLTIFCYGESCAVNMLIQYFKTNTAGGKQMDISLFLPRFVAAGVEAYTKGNDIKGKLDSKRFNKYFKANSILLTEDKFLDMMFYWNTDSMCERLEINDEQRKKMIEEITMRYFADKQQLT